MIKPARYACVAARVAIPRGAVIPVFHRAVDRIALPALSRLRNSRATPEGGKRVPPFMVIAGASSRPAAAPHAAAAIDDPTRYAGVMPTAAEFVRRYGGDALAVVDEGEL